MSQYPLRNSITFNEILTYKELHFGMVSYHLIILANEHLCYNRLLLNTHFGLLSALYTDPIWQINVQPSLRLQPKLGTKSGR